MSSFFSLQGWHVNKPAFAAMTSNSSLPRASNNIHFLLAHMVEICLQPCSLRPSLAVFPQHLQFRTWSREGEGKNTGVFCSYTGIFVSISHFDSHTRSHGQDHLQWDRAMCSAFREACQRQGRSNNWKSWVPFSLNVLLHVYTNYLLVKYHSSNLLNLLFQASLNSWNHRYKFKCY